MKKKQRTLLYSIVIICTVCLSAIIIALSFAVKTKKQNPTKWVLYSYGNNVALYKGDEIVEVYGTITIDNLPITDRRRLEAGIVFPTKEEALLAIEDYDG